MRKLFLASFGAHDAGERLLKAALGSGVAPADILYLCPSPRRIDQAKVDFLRLSGRDAVVPPQFATLPQLSREIHGRQGSARRLPAELRPLLTQRILIEEEEKRKRNPPSDGRERIPTSIGYAQAVAGFIAAVRRYVGLEDRPALPQRVSSLLAGFEKPLGRLIDGLGFLDRYEAELARLNWTDDEGIMTEAAKLVPGAKLPRVLVLDSFVAPDRLEADLLRALVGSAETTLALGYADDPSDPDYAMADRFGSFIESLGGFETDRIQGSTLPQPAFFEYADAEEEAKAVCRDIIANGVPDGTFLVVPALAEYAPLIERTFSDYGVLATVYPDMSLAESPPTVAVLELLRCLDTDFERLAAAASIGSPFLPGLVGVNADGSTPIRDRCAAAVNHYSRRAGIIKGRENWNKIRDRVIAAQNEELDETEDAILTELQSCILRATAAMNAGVPEKATIGQFASSLKRLLGQAEFLRDADTGRDEGLLKDRKRLYDILDKLVEFENDFGGHESSRAELVRTLVYLLQQEKHQNEDPAAGVAVVDMTETLGIHPRRLYFCGLTETNLPSAYTADPILPDRVRSALDMPDVNWHRDWQRFHFRRNLESSPNPPFLSYHSSRQGQPVLPTPFIVTNPTKVGRSEVICSEAEEQLAQGRYEGRRFEDTALTVDFSRDKDVLAALAHSYGPSRPVSVTRLEQYRRCPYAFYIETVLGMETPEEPSYDIDARQWGLVVHLVMEKLYAGGPIAIERISDAALKALDAALKEVELTAFWTEVTRRVFANLLPDIIRIETELHEEGFEPGRTELSLRGNLSGDISLRGRFDRIDTSGKSFRVLDYKTGTPTNVGGKAVMDGTHLQLPLYAWLFRQRNPETQPDNFGVYSLRDPRVIWFAGRKYTVEEMITAAIENAVAIVKAIRGGRFPAEPGDNRACEYCELGHTCGFRDNVQER